MSCVSIYHVLRSRRPSSLTETGKWLIPTLHSSKNRIGVYNGRPMPLPAPSTWLPRIVALLVVALIVASASFWVQRWRQDTRPLVEPMAAGKLTRPDSQAIARLLGSTGPAAPPQAPGTASRFVLTGVLASRSGSGVALIAVDGKPARIFHVGAMVTDAMVLRSVGARHANLSSTDRGDVSFTLELPALKKVVLSSIDLGSSLGQANPLGNPPSVPAFGTELNQAQPTAEPVFQNRTGAD